MFEDSQLACAVSVASAVAVRRAVDVDIACHFPFLALIDAEQGVSMGMTSGSLGIRLALHCRGGDMAVRRRNRVRSRESRKGRKTNEAQRRHPGGRAGEFKAENTPQAGGKLVIDCEWVRSEPNVFDGYMLIFSHQGLNP